MSVRPSTSEVRHTYARHLHRLNQSTQNITAQFCSDPFHCLPIPQIPESVVSDGIISFVYNGVHSMQNKTFTSLTTPHPNTCVFSSPIFYLPYVPKTVSGAPTMLLVHISVCMRPFQLLKQMMDFYVNRYTNCATESRSNIAVSIYCNLI
jgi:hypothetical protein